MTSSPHYNGPLTRALRGEGMVADPWPPEVDVAVRHPDSVPLCLNCLSPQASGTHLCANCRYPTGDRVAWMPFLDLFVMGEMFRQGVTGPPDRRVGVQCFLVVASLVKFGLFAPAYWYWMVRKARGRPISDGARPPKVADE